MFSSSTTFSRETVYNHLVQKFPSGKKLGSSGWMIYDIWDNSTSFPFSDYRAKLGLKVSSRSYSEALNHPRLPTRSRTRQLPPSNDAGLSFSDDNSVESTEANNKEITLQTPRKSRTARARAALTVDIERHFSSLTAIEDLLQTPVGIQEINRPWTLWVGGVFSYFRSFPCTDGLNNARAVLYSVLESMSAEKSEELRNPPQAPSRRLDTDMKCNLLLTLIATEGYIEQGLYSPEIGEPIVGWVNEGLLRSSLPALFSPSHKAFLITLQVFNRLLLNPYLHNGLMDLFKGLTICTMKQLTEEFADPGNLAIPPICIVNISGRFTRLYSSNDDCIGEGTRPISSLSWVEGDICTYSASKGRGVSYRTYKIDKLLKEKATLIRCGPRGFIGQNKAKLHTTVDRLKPPTADVAANFCFEIQKPVDRDNLRRFHLSWNTTEKDSDLIGHTLLVRPILCTAKEPPLIREWNSTSTGLSTLSEIPDEVLLSTDKLQPSRGVSCATCNLKDTEDLYICRWCTARNEKQFLAFHGKCPDSKADSAPFELTSEVLCTKCSTSVIFATFKKSSFFGSIPRFLKKANAPPVVATVTPEDEGLWVHNYVRGAHAAPTLDFCEQFHLLHDLKEFFQNRKDSLSDVCKSCKLTTDVPTSSCHTCGLSIHQACWCPGFSDEDTLTQDTRIICTLCTKQILLGATSLAAPARRPQPYIPRTLSLLAG